VKLQGAATALSRMRATVGCLTSLPFPIPLEVGPLNPAKGSGKRRKFPGSDRKRLFCIILLKNAVICDLRDSTIVCVHP